MALFIKLNIIDSTSAVWHVLHPVLKSHLYWPKLQIMQFMYSIGCAVIIMTFKNKYSQTFWPYSSSMGYSSTIPILLLLSIFSWYQTTACYKRRSRSLTRHGQGQEGSSSLPEWQLALPLCKRLGAEASRSHPLLLKMIQSAQRDGGRTGWYELADSPLLWSEICGRGGVIFLSHCLVKEWWN